MTLFPRSIRSLESDRFRASAVGLLVAIVILAAWLGWFFLARVAVYKVAGGVKLEQWICASCAEATPKASTARVEFPAAVALAHIRTGQTAYLHLDGLPRALYPGIPATVSNVASQVVDGNIQIELDARPDADAYVALRPNLTATVEVEVERVSPALLVLRTARRWVQQSPASEND